jgi:hypothetical protein
MRFGDCWVAVVSARRAANVAPMTRLLDTVPATWYVAAGDAGGYRDAGAAAVVESGGLAESRNRALDDAWAAGLACVQVSDDLQRLAWYDGKHRSPLRFAGALAALAAALNSTGARLAGAAPTANAYFWREPVSTGLFIVGDLVMVRPCGLHYDPLLLVKEDYDYTLQHLRRYGVAARVNGLLAQFRHRTNAGGAVAYRQPAAEQETIGYLRGKWGDVIRPHPRRRDEITIRWRPR